MFHRESGVFKTSYAADMALYPLPIARWAVAAFAGLFIVIAPLTLGEYYISILNLILIAVVGALGLNILVGYTGQISIGHGAFMSVGAYTAANLVVHLDAAVLDHDPGRRPDGGADRRGGRHPVVAHQRASISPSPRSPAQLIIEWTINHVPAISGGVQASIQVPRPTLFGTQLKTQTQLYLFLMFFAVLAIVATSNLVRSRIGRAFVAIRDQDIAAEIIGINIFRYKLWASRSRRSTPASPGVLYTYYLGIANYEQFQINVSIDYLAMIIIGGLGSILGSILGAIFVTLLPIVTRWFLEEFGGLFFSPGRSVEHHPQSAADPVRRADHLLPGGRAGRAEPALAQYPKLLPGLAILVLSRPNQAGRVRRHEAMNRFGSAGGGAASWRSPAAAAAQQKEIADRRAVRPHRRRRRSSASVLCPAYPGLLRPDQLARAASKATRSRSSRSTTNTKCRRRSRRMSARRRMGAVLDAASTARRRRRR